MKNCILLLIAACFFLLSNNAKADIPNFGKINDQIYHGGRPATEADIQKLKSLGIKTIINLQGGDLRNQLLRKIVAKFELGELPSVIRLETERASAAGIKDYSFPLDSIGKVTDQDDQAVDMILQIMTDPKALPVFVHCEHGRDRTGMILSLYRVKTNSISIHQAHEEWESYGHEEINSLFTIGLETYFYRKAAQIRSEN